MDFGCLPPEVNSRLMYCGPGSGPMLAAAAGWDAVAANLESTASGYSSAVVGLSGQAWSGPSSMLMAAAATPYVEWLSTAAAQAGQTAAQAYGAAAAYEAAFAMTVPPPAIAANRAQLMALIATNFFGQNTPAIAATEAHYMEMWAQDATAMYVYAADSSTSSTLTPFNEPPQTTNQAGQGAQASAVAQTAANTTSAHTQALAQQLASTAGVDPSVGPGGTVTAGPNGATITVTQGSVTVPTGGIISVGPTDTLTAGPAGATLSPPVSSGLNSLSFMANAPISFPVGYPTSMLTVSQGSVVVTSTGNSGSISLSAGSSVTAGASGATFNVVLGSVTNAAAAPTSAITGAVLTTGTITTGTTTSTVITTVTAPATTIPTTTGPAITLTTFTSTPEVFTYTPAEISQAIQSAGLSGTPAAGILESFEAVHGMSETTQTIQAINAGGAAAASAWADLSASGVETGIDIEDVFEGIEAIAELLAALG